MVINSNILSSSSMLQNMIYEVNKIKKSIKSYKTKSYLTLMFPLISILCIHNCNYIFKDNLMIFTFIVFIISANRPFLSFANIAISTL